MSIPRIGDPFSIKAEIDAVTDAPVSGEGETVEIIRPEDVVRSGPHFAHGDILVGLVDITPDLSTEWLDRYNTHNRNPIKSAIAGYSRDMDNGDWLFIGDTIRFAVNPKGETYLADGQNRLESIAKSGISQTYIVVTGLEDDAQAVMDSQRVRTFANMLTLEENEDGEKEWTDVNRLGAIIRRVFMFDHFGRVPRGGGTINPTKPELRKFLSTHADRFRRAVTVCQAAGSVIPKLGKSATMIGAAYFILSRKDQEAADLFFREMLIKGFHIDDEHPVTHLRRRYGNTGLGAIDDDEAFRLTFKAWNHWRKNEKLEKTVQVPRNGWPVDFREYPIF